MTNEEAVKYGTEWLKDEYLDARDGVFIKTALEALRQEPCDDCISRQVVLERLKREEKILYTPTGMNYLIRVIEGLPPVTPQVEKIRAANIHFDEEKFKEICKNAPLTILDDSNTPTIQPKTGRWIDIMVGDIPAQACDQCSTFYPLAYTGGGHKYCPNCGAKMEVEE